MTIRGTELNDAVMDARHDHRELIVVSAIIPIVVLHWSGTEDGDTETLNVSPRDEFGRGHVSRVLLQVDVHEASTESSLRRLYPQVLFFANRQGSKMYRPTYLQQPSARSGDAVYERQTLYELPAKQEWSRNIVPHTNACPAYPNPLAWYNLTHLTWKDATEDSRETWVSPFTIPMWTPSSRSEQAGHTICHYEVVVNGICFDI